MDKSRNRNADLLKGMAVLLMVQVHIIELFAQQNIYDSFGGSVLLFLGGPPAAPVFMTVMGYFIAMGNRSFSKSLIRGVKLMGLGLLLNFGLNFHLFISIYNQTIITSPWPYLFGVDILFLAGLSIIALAIFQSVFNKRLIPYILLIISILLIHQLLPYPENSGAWQYITALFYGDNWWSYFPVIPWLVYPVAGYIFYLILPSISKITNKWKFILITLFLTGAVFTITIGYGIKIASNLHNYYHHDYLYFLFVLNFMVLWTILLGLITKLPKNFIVDYVEWTGKNVTAYYIFQWLIIGNIATSIYKTQNSVQLIIWYVVIVIISSLLTLLWDKIKKWHPIKSTKD